VTDSSSGTYTIDPANSRLGFAVRHAEITRIRGSFTEFAGHGYLDAANPSRSWARVMIRAASVTTNNPERDALLLGTDFLDADRYPEITFVSTGVESVDDTTFRLTGDLTMKGATRTVGIHFDLTGTSVDATGNTRVGFYGSGVIDRREWGVTWNTPLASGGVLVSDDVELAIDVCAIRTDEPPTR